MEDNDLEENLSNGGAEDDDQQSPLNTARKQLRGRLLGMLYRSLPIDIAMQEAVDIVKEFPELGVGYFGHCQIFFTPLHCFLVCKASLSQVKALLNAVGDDNRESCLARRDRDGELPLHVACQYASAGVIEYLALEYADALSEKCDIGCLPLHFALTTPSGRGHQIDTETVKLLVELYPEAIPVSDAGGRTPLSMALKHGFPIEVIGYMAEQYPVDHSELVVGAAIDEDLFLDLDRVQAIKKIISHIKYMKLDASRWESSEALCNFLQSLENNQSISKIGYLALPTHLFQSHPELAVAVQRFLQHNSTLTQVHFSICDADYICPYRLESPGDIALLESVKAGLPENRTVELMELQRLLLSDMGQLISLLASPAPPQKLNLYNIKILGPWNDQAWGESHEVVASSRLEHLLFQYCGMPDECWTNLFHNLPRLPNLRILKICPNAHEMTSAGKQFFSDCDFTDPLVYLLTHGSLSHLTIPGFLFDMSRICQALQTNTTLRHFCVARSPNMENETAAKACVDLLKRQNTTLTHLAPYTMRKEVYPKINHLLYLNTFGRARVRDTETDLSDFISILNSVNQVKELLSDPHEKESVLFGLLLEAPSFWSSSTSFCLHGNNDKCRKRKFPTVS
jgi:hypothetical protein